MFQPSRVVTTATKVVCAAFALLILGGCASAPPGTEKVVVVRDRALIVNCRYIGPYAINGEPATNPGVERVMKGIAYSQGGDTVLYVPVRAPPGDDERILPLKTGIAFAIYNCSGVDPRQPLATPGVPVERAPS